MTKYVCPCCGNAFNGKKCRQCYYETFDDEISHSLHTHQTVNKVDVLDIPKMPKTPVRRPDHVQKEWEQQKREFRRSQEKRRAKKGFPKWLVWILVFSLLEPAIEILGTIIEEVSYEFSDAFITREEAYPEPEAVLPESAEAVFSADGFTVYIEESPDGYQYPLYLENTSGREVRLSARQIIVDGFLSERSSAYCSGDAGTILSGELYLDFLDMQYATMDTPGQIDVEFVIYDSDSYEDILECNFTIGQGSTAEIPPPAGDALLDNGQVQIRSLGFQPDDYAPEVIYQGTQLVYLENTTEHTLSIYADSILMNGEETNLGLWTELPPQTRTVTRIWLYSLEDMGIETLDQAGPLELNLVAYDNDTGAATTLDTITIPFF